MSLIVRSGLTLIYTAAMFTAAANPIAINNPGFEAAATFPISLAGVGTASNIVSPSIYPVGGTLPGWIGAASTLSGDGGGFAPVSGGAFNWTTTWWSGNNVAFLQAGALGTSASLSQTLADVLLSDTAYTLSALVGNRKFSNLQDFSLQLLVGSSVLASGGNNVALTNDSSGIETVLYSSGANNPLAGQALTIRMLVTGLAGSQIEVPTEAYFDNIALDAVTTTSSVVPEPSSFAISAGALIALAVVARRKRIV